MKLTLKNRAGFQGALPRRQKGALTMFSAVLILILLTELIIYAVQVGVFEQRKSSNEMRQKEAFHVAESAIQYAKQYFLLNSRQLSSANWLATRWKPCSEAGLSAAQGTHPCYAEPADNDQDFVANLRDNMYFWDPDDGDLKGADPYSWPTLPIDVGGVITDATQRANTYALLCMLHIERDPAARTVAPNSPVQGCTTEPDLQNPVYFMVTLMARGEADCDGGDCSARALITERVGSFGPAVGEGGPGVPLVARTTLPPGGTAEIVPNPNGGGVGVPISAWINQNPACFGPNDIIPPALDPNGASWSTCERHEWYGADMWPEGYRCPSPPCKCDSAEKRLSYSDNEGQKFGIDLLPDDTFPCDLWDYMFGVPKYDENGDVNLESVDFVRNYLADEIVQGEDCGSSLGPESTGWIWIEGGACNIAGGTEIGSPDTDPNTPEGPVFLIVTSDFKLAGGASVFGTIFLTDVLQSTTELAAVGGLTVYGAAVVDATIDKFSGTYQVVYVEDIIERSVENGKFGAVSGGWSDFHADWR